MANMLMECPFSSREEMNTEVLFPMREEHHPVLCKGLYSSPCSSIPMIAG